MRILTMQEAADFLQVKVSTVWRWARNGQLPVTKIGRIYRIKETALMEYIESQS